MTDETLGPLPDYAQEFRPRWGGDVGGFTSDQMRTYAAAQVAAERERCAKAAEDFLTKGRSPLGRSVAAAIRANT